MVSLLVHDRRPSVPRWFHHWCAHWCAADLLSLAQGRLGSLSAVAWARWPAGPGARLAEKGRLSCSAIAAGRPELPGVTPEGAEGLGADAVARAQVEAAAIRPRPGGAVRSGHPGDAMIGQELRIHSHIAPSVVCGVGSLASSLGQLAHQVLVRIDLQLRQDAFRLLVSLMICHELTHVKDRKQPGRRRPPPKFNE